APVIGLEAENPSGEGNRLGRDSKGAALMFLDRIAEELGLPINKIEVCPGRVVSIMTWEGTNPALKTILLNSHTDCVPVYHVKTWSTFSSPDARCRGKHLRTYIQAIRRLKADGRKFTRTIHLMFVTDEEVGGLKGMETFVKLPEFQKLNISFALDEGLANPGEAFTVFYGERNPWCEYRVPTWPKTEKGADCDHLDDDDDDDIDLTCFCLFPFSQRSVINSFLDYREKEKVRLVRQCFTLGDVTTINVTMVKVGVAKTVIPAEMDVSFDLRIPPTVNLQVLTSNKAGEGGYLKIMFVLLLVLALSAIGFSPMNWTPILLHNHNEYLNEQVFLKTSSFSSIDLRPCLVPLE
uniref:Uncharacterized protein n=1 Tax=Salmo trutta TaxID=8032 RepID=A0A673ZE54_SALTR